MIPDDFRLELDKLKAYHLTKNCHVIELTPLFRSQKRDLNSNCKPISREHAYGACEGLAGAIRPGHRI